MAETPDVSLDHLWKEYSAVFRDFDDLTLARWLCQTLGQLEARAWRLSHPLIGAYRLGAQVADERQIWHKRLATPPQAYWQSECCGAPILPLFTRDITETGLICQHCGDTCIPFDEIPNDIRREVKDWSAQYAPIHAVAHWDDGQRKKAGNYEAKFEFAATQAEQLLSLAGAKILPRFLDTYPAVVWEDQDECLEVQPEDIKYSA
jgi:hypothetical protein